MKTNVKKLNKGLLWACENNNVDVASVILAAKAVLPTTKNEPTVTDDEGIPAIIRCVEYGSSAIIELLLAYGEEVNSYSDTFPTLLIEACRRKKNSIVKLLLKKGAHIDQKWKGNGEETNALHEAVKIINIGDMAKVTPILHTLFAAGVDISDSNNVSGRTPLMIAATWGCNEMLSRMIFYAKSGLTIEGEYI